MSGVGATLLNLQTGATDIYFPGNTFFDTVIVNRQVAAPRRIVISFSGIAAFNETDRMVDGSSTIDSDNALISSCLGRQVDFWTFVGADLDD